MTDTTEAHEVGELLSAAEREAAERLGSEVEWPRYTMSGDILVAPDDLRLVLDALARRSVTSEAGVREALVNALTEAREYIDPSIPREMEDEVLRIIDAALSSAEASRSPRPAEASAPVAEWVRPTGVALGSDHKHVVMLYPRALSDAEFASVRDAALAASPAPASGPSRAQNEAVDAPHMPSLERLEQLRVWLQAICNSGQFTSPFVDLLAVVEASRAPTIPSPAPAEAEVSEEQIERGAIAFAETETKIPWVELEEGSRKGYRSVTGTILRAAHGGQHE